MPCFPRVVCSNNDTAFPPYDCGDCPSGYVGNGIICHDINANNVWDHDYLCLQQWIRIDWEQIKNVPKRWILDRLETPSIKCACMFGRGKTYRAISRWTITVLRPFRGYPFDIKNFFVSRP
jgi:hypothetical protein